MNGIEFLIFIIVVFLLATIVATPWIVLASSRRQKREADRFTAILHGIRKEMDQSRRLINRLREEVAKVAPSPPPAAGAGPVPPPAGPPVKPVVEAHVALPLEEPTTVVEIVAEPEQRQAAPAMVCGTPAISTPRTVQRPHCAAPLSGSSSSARR